MHFRGGNIDLIGIASEIITNCSVAKQFLSFKEVNCSKYRVIQMFSALIKI